MLLRLIGQTVDCTCGKPGCTVGREIDSGRGWFVPTVKNLYDPANMALAWRVLNWWYDYIATTDNEAVDPEDGFFDVGKLMHGVWAQPPADAQRAWLDKILTLAMAAGMVTE